MMAMVVQIPATLGGGSAPLTEQRAITILTNEAIGVDTLLMQSGT